ncbi:ABC transporter substrate-binding protein [Yinghuangia seranimata]|uniref:ABC transporter substrate-binding protein n=1 Tax=Yinghuangia seranimata TaxID=408067 RepID=UPI00248C4FC7|nr:sugar ABC transporter substrate-binding protein [Yinghuangia seranimata]MDI2130101.1 sugar ABC transporter substrate-binding protein [Yinghuangia seranimata]
MRFPWARKRSTRRGLAATAAAALALAAAGCGGGSGGSGGSPDTGKKVDPSAVQGALDKPAEITFWTWVPNIDKTVALFEKKYPNVKVNIVNGGLSKDEYIKLTTALKAGSGAPDVVQVEYSALPQFALTKSLVNLADYGASDLKDKFTPSAWSQVNVAGGVYGIPQDTGPMAMFYRKDVFDKIGATPPKTWDEFAAVAKKVHDADPTVSMTFADPDDPGTATSMMWQFGGKPFTVKGTDIAVDLKSDPGAKTYAEVFGPLVKDKLVDGTAGYSSDWWTSMAAGKYAVWMAGAWAPNVLEQFIPQSKGQWGVAPMPGGGSAENGGSSVAVTTQAKNKEASIAFAEWLNSDPEAVRSLNGDVGLFPATNALLDDPAFRSAEVRFFPGQKPNEVFSEMSKAVRPGWQYLPYEVYADSVFKDTVGQALTSGGDLGAALAGWQDRIKSYGKEQGFTVK